MKMRITLLIIAAFILLPGSSPWEGAGAVAPAGELPASGFFVATNSFPRNTVVDITNIETGKSTRAIVANTLNSPGLLAIVSREAADLIDMRPGSTSRIRMIQPADPIAYLRFTESLSQGAPGFDSGSIINEEALLADVYRGDSYRPPVLTPSEASSTGGITGPSYSLEPEWSGIERMNVVDVPALRENTQQEIEESHGSSIFVVETPRAAETHRTIEEQRDIIKDISERIEEFIYSEVVKEVNEFEVERLAEDVDKAPGEFIAEIERDDVEKEVYEYITEVPRDEIIKDLEREVYVAETQPQQMQEEHTPTHYNLVHTDEQPPPESIYGIDPNDIIPGVAIATPERQPENTAPITSFIPPVSERTSPIPAPVINEQNFSIRTISRLDRGQYYVQVAALPAESVENAVRQIDRNYDPVVYRDGSNLYRILIGPLNQGESAAILARFKSIGYRDAFVRHGG